MLSLVSEKIKGFLDAPWEIIKTPQALQQANRISIAEQLLAVPAALATGYETASLLPTHEAVFPATIAAALVLIFTLERGIKWHSNVEATKMVLKTNPNYFMLVSN